MSYHSITDREKKKEEERIEKERMRRLMVCQSDFLSLFIVIFSTGCSITVKGFNPGVMVIWVIVVLNRTVVDSD